ncbi:MAG: pyruvate dehydrogenase (acetyl-transferring) E1 component subunit alpha [Thermomicrobiales bacterium]|nr:pyruvate dehydrogenase (acetyl-transferring) E1 component subunit alpha [Thermomicrobiales bacterium]
MASKTEPAVRAGETALGSMSKDELLGLYREMVLIRRFEERSAEQYAFGKIGGFLHLYIGEEATGVGAISVLKQQDHLVTHYRDHGYALAIGADPNAIMAELFGRSTGTTGGRGGSMHMIHPQRNFWGGYAIVSGHILIGAGIGMALKYQEIDGVSLVIFGDGATNGGAFFEALNMASLWKLPVIFLCENNEYAMGTAIEYHSAVPKMSTKAEGLGIKSEIVDGQDVLAMREATQRARDYCTAGNGPYFLEAMTYRFRGHSMADPETYREKDEIEEKRATDPIPAYREQLLHAGKAEQADFDKIDEEIEIIVEEAVQFADKSPWPDPSTLEDFVYADEY